MHQAVTIHKELAFVGCQEILSQEKFPHIQ